MIGLNGALLGSRRATDVEKGPGVWTLKEHAVRRKSNTWPYGPTDGDPYFNLVQALFFFDSDFYDRSSYNLNVGQQDTPQISTSVYRHGTGSFDSTLLAPGAVGPYIYWDAPAPLGANNYTIEGWVRPNSAYASAMNGDEPSVFQLRVGGADAGGLELRGHGSTLSKIQLAVEIRTNGSGGKAFVVSPSTSTEINYDEWTHFAVVKNLNQYKLYLNGVDTNTGSVYVLDHNGYQTWRVLRDESGGGRFRGFLDTFRITNGVARYTSNYIPPAAAFPYEQDLDAVQDPDFSSVSLLLHMDGGNGGLVIYDSSSNAFAVNNSNNQFRLSTAQKKFGTASGVSAASGHYLSVTSSLVAIAAIDFTIESWIRMAALPLSGVSSLAFSGSQFSDDNRVQIHVNPSGTISGLLQAGAGTQVSFTSAALLSLNTWYHVAFVKSGTNVYLFINGSLEASGSYTNTIIPSSTFYVALGRSGGYTYSFSGGTSGGVGNFIDDFRLTRVARYTSNFAPPTARFPNS